jgi:hypothetical protein
VIWRRPTIIGFEAGIITIEPDDLIRRAFKFQQFDDSESGFVLCDHDRSFARGVASKTRYMRNSPFTSIRSTKFRTRHYGENGYKAIKKHSRSGNEAAEIFIRCRCHLGKSLFKPVTNVTRLGAG